MKRKIKLRDITAEQWDKNRISFCKLTSIGCCDNCPFQWIGGSCGDSFLRSSWINHKDCYSDKILNQEIEIEVPDNILDEIEKEYLSAVIRPFKNRVIFIKKVGCTNDKYFISIKISSKLSLSGNDIICLPLFQNKMYKEMEINKEYTLEELGLFPKITLSEFWNSKEKLVIHCNTKEKANKLLKAFDKIGKTWETGLSYLKMNYWYEYEKDTCYSNKNLYEAISYYKTSQIKIYEFEDIDLNN